MPVLPESQRPTHTPHAPSLDADPLRYLRGVLAFFLGGGIVVALVFALSGVAPRAWLVAGLLWTLLGLLTGMVDLVLEPLAEFIGALFARAGSGASEAVADQIARARQEPAPAAVSAIEELRRDAGRLSPADDIRLGLALAELHERLQEPGQALTELRRLIDRYPHRRQTVELRGRLAALRARHFAVNP